MSLQEHLLPSDHRCNRKLPISMGGCSSGPEKDHKMDSRTKGSSGPESTSHGLKLPKELASIKALSRGYNLEKAMAALVLVFYSSAGPDGRVSRRAVRDILLKQFQAFTRGQESKASYMEVMKELESHGERKMALEDFLLLTLSLSVTSDLLEAIQEAGGQ